MSWFSATVSVLCRRSKKDHLTWGTYAGTNSRRFNSWPKRTDVKNPRQDGFSGFPGLFNLHSSVYSHPRSHFTRSCWNCCVQRHVDGLDHGDKWNTDIKAGKHRSSCRNPILVVQSVSARSYAVWHVICCLATRHTKLRKRVISSSVTWLPTIYLVATFACNQLSLKRRLFCFSFSRAEMPPTIKQEILLKDYNELIILESWQRWITRSYGRSSYKLCETIC